MEQIRIQRGIEIGVNDNGDTITLDVENAKFVERFNGLVEKVQKVADSLEGADVDNTEDFLKLVTEKMEEIAEGIDEHFGKDTCKKVFGSDVVPSPFAVIDFFEQLTPIVEKYTKQREARIANKYTARKGGKKK